MVDVCVGVRETRETSQEVQGVRLDETVVELVKDPLFHAEYLQSCVGVSCDVLQLVDRGSVDLFELGGDEERC